MIKSKIRKYHAPVWDEPLVMHLSVPGRRGSLAPEIEAGISAQIKDASNLIAPALQRK